MNTEIFKALAEPNRLDIIQLLLKESLTVGEIANKLKLNQPQTSKHLRVLDEAGLGATQPFGDRRIYKIRPEPLEELDDWLATYRHLWEERMDRLDDYLQVLQGKKPLN